MRLQNVGIEVTRKCNIKCAHCLRGDSQNRDIDYKYIDTLLDKTDSIGALCFTGGEPSLNVPAMQYTINECKRRNISIDKFYIATNGIDIKEDFVNVCEELYTLCKNGGNVQISNDIYHRKQQKYNDKLLKFLPFYSKRQDNDRDDLISVNRLHKEGRGESLPTATRISVPHKGYIYLNIDGNIIDGCDWSYASQEHHIICNVNTLEDYYNLIV
jgi:hypothetical protein